MVHSKYYVRKLRFGSINRWGPWEYEAVSDSVDYKADYKEKRGTSVRHPTIDSLAGELSGFPGITEASFVPEERSAFKTILPSRYFVPKEDITDCVRGVSIAISTLTTVRVLTQWGTVNDEELGELALKVFQYYREQRIREDKFVT